MNHDSTAQDFTDQVARSLADPEHLLALLGPRRAATLNNGLCGTALALAVLCGTDRLLARAATRHWDIAVQLLKNSAPDGIHRGPGALATSLVLAAPYLPAAHRRSEDADRAVHWLTARAHGLARYQHDRLQRGDHGTPWDVYDAIKGLAGIGGVLLGAAQTGRHQAAEPGLTAALTTLTRMINTPAGPYPGWWLPQHDHHLATATPIPATGAATTGLAHGIAGPLALLALAAQHGHTVPGQRDAITTAATWLLDTRSSTGNWSAHISGHHLRHPRTPLPDGPTRRDAWCYGNAGIGNALVHAGTATREPAFTRAGHTALAVIAAKPPHNWDTTGPGICHGTAGVLLTALAHQHRQLAHQARDATTRHLNSPSNEPTDPDPGLLTGAAGTALALNEPDHPARGAPSWTALLLLA
jgi:hypothetical protein